MPFSENRGSIAILSQDGGQSGLVVGQVLGAFDVLKLLKWKIFSSGQPIGEMQARWVFTGQNAGTSRRANRTGGIRARKSHPSFRKGVDIGSLIKRAALVTNIGPAEVVDKEKHDVRTAIAVRFLCRGKIIQSSDQSDRP